MREESFNKNNKGISLIELIIVIAIISVVGGAVFLSTSVATNKHVYSCAEKIGTALEQTRSLALGRQEVYIEFYQGSDGLNVQMHCDGSNYGNLVTIGHSGLTVTYTQSDGTSGTVGATPIKIYFSRNGSVSDKGVVVSQFEVTNGNRTYDIDIDTFTGRVAVNRVP